MTLSGTGTPNTTLSIDRALPGQAYKALAMASVDGYGHWSRVLTVNYSGTYRTRSAEGRASAGRTVAVCNAITMTAVRKGFRTYKLSGTVSPARNGQAVKVMVRKPNGSYALLRTVQTDANGHWSYKRKYAASRTYTFRAVSGDTNLNDPGSVTKNVAVR